MPIYFVIRPITNTILYLSWLHTSFLTFKITILFQPTLSSVPTSNFILQIPYMTTASEQRSFGYSFPMTWNVFPPTTRPY